MEHQPIKPSPLFSWVDHSAFATMLASSLAIGVYFGVCGRRRNVAKVDYLHGGKTMSVLPIAISQVASHISASTLVGVPSEVYLYGAMYGWVCVSTIIFGIVMYYVYLPVFFGLQLTSTYEYLELRFNRTIRQVASFLFTLNLILHLPMYVYIPALSYSQVSGVSVHFITPVTCAVCIIYTMMGGIKAVVWTDFLQAGVALGSIFAIVVLGVQAAGGLENVWSTALEGGRLDVFQMTPNPFVRTSFWSYVIGITVAWLAGTAIHQGMVQKFLALPDMASARRALGGFVFGIMLSNGISVFNGILLYSSYAQCDPIATHAVTRADQVLPLYVMQVGGHIPALPGLFVAGIFAASLSSMSGVFNALSATIYEDFVLPLVPHKTSDVTVNRIMKSIVFVVGLVTIALVFAVERLGTIVELAYSVSGLTTGAMLGIFSLGMLVPSANTKGAMAGGVCGVLVVGVVVVGAQHALATGALVHPKLPTSVAGCSDNITAELVDITTSPRPSEEGTESSVPLLFRLSFMYYSLLGALTVLIVGWVVSALTGPRTDVDPALLAPQLRPRQSAEERAAGVKLLPRRKPTAENGFTKQETTDKEADRAAEVTLRPRQTPADDTQEETQREAEERLLPRPASAEDNEDDYRQTTCTETGLPQRQEPAVENGGVTRETTYK